MHTAMKNARSREELYTSTLLKNQKMVITFAIKANPIQNANHVMFIILTAQLKNQSTCIHLKKDNITYPCIKMDKNKKKKKATKYS